MFGGEIGGLRSLIVMRTTLRLTGCIQVLEPKKVESLRFLLPPGCERIDNSNLLSFFQILNFFFKLLGS